MLKPLLYNRTEAWISHLEVREVLYIAHQERPNSPFQRESTLVNKVKSACTGCA